MMLHAVEELYFFRRYEEARTLVGRFLEGELNDEFRKTILDYRDSCEAKIRSKGSSE